RGAHLVLRRGARGPRGGPGSEGEGPLERASRNAERRAPAAPGAGASEPRRGEGESHRACPRRDAEEAERRRAPPFRGNPRRRGPGFASCPYGVLREAQGVFPG